jgi:transcriptional regulator with XRE-family HTH domain
VEKISDGRPHRERARLTQVELAQRIGIIQSIVSAIERDVLRLSAEMAVRFAQALDATTDELIQPKARNGKTARKPSRKVLRRLEQIERLPATQQTTLLRTIDTFLKAAAIR